MMSRARARAFGERSDHAKGLADRGDAFHPGLRAARRLTPVRRRSAAGGGHRGAARREEAIGGPAAPDPPLLFQPGAELSPTLLPRQPPAAPDPAPGPRRPRPPPPHPPAGLSARAPRPKG